MVPDKPKSSKMRKLFLILVIIAVIAFGAAFSYKLLTKHSTPAVSGTKTTQGASTASSTQPSPLSLFPNSQINCSTSVSLVPLSVDYTITGMNCLSVPSNSVAIICNGTIMQRATIVSIGCYPPGHYTSADHLICSGSTNEQSNPTNLSLSYNCALPNLSSTTTIYSCSGSITNYGSFSINLPLDTSCNRA